MSGDRLPTNTRCESGSAEVAFSEASTSVDACRRIQVSALIVLSGENAWAPDRRVILTAVRAAAARGYDERHLMAELLIVRNVLRLGPDYCRPTYVFVRTYECRVSDLIHEAAR